MRFVLLHNHLYKNGGSTVDHVFEKAGFRNTPLEATADEPVVSPRRVVEAVLADPSVEYISSHVFRTPRPADLDLVGFIDITFVRHPIDRLHSIYRYSRQPGVHDFPAIDKNATFAQFVDAMTSDAPAHLHSPQTTCLGNYRDFYYPPSGEALARARKAVQEARFLGVVDLFELSFQTFVACCAPLLRGKDLGVLAGPIEPVNRSEGGAERMEDRLERVAKELGTERMRFVERANAADMELYRTAREELLRRHAFALATA